MTRSSFTKATGVWRRGALATATVLMLAGSASADPTETWVQALCPDESPARQARVAVYDVELGRQLAHGRADVNGYFAVAAEPDQELIAVTLASSLTSCDGYAGTGRVNGGGFAQVTAATAWTSLPSYEGPFAADARVAYVDPDSFEGMGRRETSAEGAVPTYCGESTTALALVWDAGDPLTFVPCAAPPGLFMPPTP
ncbi:MAG: hypothetical protein HYV63_00305 [Candidatus Schekmanbacteria bacterium]|nr:hypothetical protein [Candidatus Schekmanbacteria bacterium]